MKITIPNFQLVNIRTVVNPWTERQQSLLCFFISGCLGIIVFILLYGWRVLNPFYVDWLVVYGGDTVAHYVGWELFRSGEWRFPFGLTNTLLYPFDTSVIFTDSLPLFALPFKLLTKNATTSFQYFGWWGVLCFFLQGGISAAILRKYTNGIYACIGSVFFQLRLSCYIVCIVILH